jgi:hypothetical protein
MHNVKIVDDKGNLIGERFDVTSEEVRKFISKGFHVIDVNNHSEITEEMVMEQVGVSECILV